MGGGECVSVLPEQQMQFNGGRMLEWFLGRQEQSLLQQLCHTNHVLESAGSSQEKIASMWYR